MYKSYTDFSTTVLTLLILMFQYSQTTRKVAYAFAFFTVKISYTVFYEIFKNNKEPLGAFTKIADPVEINFLWMQW
jgi:hypothetical protein